MHRSGDSEQELSRVTAGDTFLKETKHFDLKSPSMVGKNSRSHPHGVLVACVLIGIFPLLSCDLVRAQTSQTFF